MGDLDVAGLGVDVVARDADTLVLAKPAGTASETRDPDGPDLLARVRRAGWAEARLPHRLDRVTAGLLVVARDAASVEVHNADLREDRWTKRYVARISAHGATTDDLLGTHRRYLRREGRHAAVVRSGGKPAWEDHEVVAGDPDRRDVRQVLVRLRTGRYHQVRALLADLGAPLVGDTEYGGVPDHAGPWLVHAWCGGIRLEGTPTDVALPSRHVPFTLADAVAGALAARAG